ncbi:hypothetical protein [Polaromonas sp.]|uniref:hypothetical protein n=1 Tax=Polaromonas sp. TaxID=1869339 RepID=UPI0032660379
MTEVFEGSPSAIGSDIFIKMVMPVIRVSAQQLSPQDLAGLYGGFISAAYGSIAADFGNEFAQSFITQIGEMLAGMAPGRREDHPMNSATFKERGILFSAPMVHALQREVDPKTQTRRPVKGEPLKWLGEAGFSPEFVADPANHLCPYGYAGDRIWVRETFFAFGRWETRFSGKKGRDEWHFIDMTLECGKAYHYSADGAPAAFQKGNQRGGVLPAWWRRPAIFMPRVASRITLEVTGVRVERLQDISEADAEAEGVDFLRHVPDADETLTARQLYKPLWETINGAGSWDANPWVWAIDFKRIEQLARKS